MATKNLETPREDVNETRRDLNELESEIRLQETGDDKPKIKYIEKSKTNEKLEKLSKDPDVKNWFDKIAWKWLANTISTFEKDYLWKETKNKWGIETRTRTIIQKHPDLRYYLCWNLWLPYQETVGKRTKFSQLTFEQKLWFMAVYNTLRLKNFDASKFDSKMFIEKCQGYKNDYWNSMMNHFNNEIQKYTQMVWPFTGNNYLNLKRLLKESYWLTDTECKKMTDYLTEFQKEAEKSWVTEAWLKPRVKWVLYGLWALALMIAGAVAFNYFSDKANPLAETETKESWGEANLYLSEDVFQIISKRNHYRAEKDGKPVSKHFEEKAIEFKKDGWLGILHEGIIEDAINYFEWRKLDLKYDIEIWYIFDGKWMEIKAKKNDKWEWEVTVKVKKPIPEAMGYSFEVTRSKREKIFNLNKFDDFEFRAAQSCIDDALNKAKDSKHIEEARTALEEGLKDHLNNTWICVPNWVWTLMIKAGDIKNVKVEYID